MHYGLCLFHKVYNFADDYILYKIHNIACGNTNRMPDLDDNNFPLLDLQYTSRAEVFKRVHSLGLR